MTQELVQRVCKLLMRWLSFAAHHCTMLRRQIAPGRSAGFVSSLGNGANSKTL